MLNEAGGVIDDLIVYRRGEEHFLAVVNAGNTAADLDWMRRAAGPECEIRDRSADYALLALQGPRAVALLGGMVRDDVSSLPSFGFAEMSLAEVDVLVARTGYTGEDGFEILTASADGVAVWNALMECGQAAGLVPVGLGARDTLRLEAGLLLHGNDMTLETSALEAGLGFILRWNAGDFIGKEALLRQKEAGLQRRQRGLEMLDRGIARHGHAVIIDGEARGEVTSGSFAPFLKKNIARAYLPSGSAQIDTEVEVDVRGRRLRAKVVKTPFYRRPRR
jgi:aminomethyltransferase